jgi:nickel/cobalt transporter (NiCoT) family protein
MPLLLPLHGLRGAAAAQARMGLIGTLIVVANVASWFWAWTLFSETPALFSAAMLAYILGLRHAVDADHIAAIDNVVRRLVQNGQKSDATGFFFSLGHSLVVLAAVILIAASANVLDDRFESIRAAAGVVGKAIAALLLLTIGCANLAVLGRLWKAMLGASDAEHNADAVDLLGPPNGVLARMCAPLFRAISRSWHMVPLGILFGLSFETASEVGLLGLSAGEAGRAHAMWSILVFPALFASAMTLVDTADGVLMVRAYGWALVNGRRKLWYNFAMTFSSVAVAFFIATVQIANLLVERLVLQGPLWETIADFANDLTAFGVVIIGIFMGTWIVSMALYRWQRRGLIIASQSGIEEVKLRVPR